jgi:uncharacterized protein (DUF1697 family)
MEKLRGLFTELGFDNVNSYINSGNIFFDTKRADRNDIVSSIEQHLLEALGYAVPVFLRTVSELEFIISEEPFKNIELSANDRFCVIFTKEMIDTKIALPQHSSKNDMDLVVVNKYEAFVVWHIINSRPPSGKFDVSLIPSTNTSRFYQTIPKILAAAKSK